MLTIWQRCKFQPCKQTVVKKRFQSVNEDNWHLSCVRISKKKAPSHSLIVLEGIILISNGGFPFSSKVIVFHNSLNSNILKT